jgi:ribonucleoside-triphosphate reductase (thioredoxin)
MAIDVRRLMSETKFYEAYSRLDEEKEHLETWSDAIDRVMNMHKTYYKNRLTSELLDYIKFAEQSYKDKLILGATQTLQFAGSQLLTHPSRNYPCSASYIDRTEFFGEYFYLLLCGCGVGFSVQKHHIAKLPKIIQRTKNPKLFEVPDCIEGWATAVDILLSSFFETDGKYPEFKGHRVYFDLSKIRSKGSYISGGFLAPGPDPLRKALDQIEYLLQGLVIHEKKASITSIIAYDICMFISDAVLSGGVRRAATICVFSYDDEDMLNAKIGNWFQKNPQRARSNNSALLLRNKVTNEEFNKIMTRVKEFGEPGFIFTDDLETLFNPCVEIGLYGYSHNDDGTTESGFQFCNLTEINGVRCNSEKEFYKACKASAILGTLQAGYTDFKFLSPSSKKITERESLLGCSITGWMNNPEILFNKDILKRGIEIIKETNEIVAKMLEINPAARLTTVKPSGTSSILLSCASGISGEHSKYYIRNVQMNKETEIAKLFQKRNPYMIEDSIWSAGNTDFVVSFPITAPKNSIFKEDLFGVKLLEKVKFIQENWIIPGTVKERCVNKTITHNVSNTISVPKDEWDEVSDFVFENKNYFAGIAFLSATGDKDYAQAPFTSIKMQDELIESYGPAAIFASGLIVEGLKLFDNLWIACSALEYGLSDTDKDEHRDNLKKEWIRRLKNFAANYFDNDMKKAEYCLKDCFLFHKWMKITQNLKDINFSKELIKKAYVPIDTLGAIACSGGNCEV